MIIAITITAIIGLAIGFTMVYKLTTRNKL